MPVENKALSIPRDPLLGLKHSFHQEHLLSQSDREPGTSPILPGHRSAQWAGTQATLVPLPGPGVRAAPLPAKAALPLRRHLLARIRPGLWQSPPTAGSSPTDLRLSSQAPHSYLNCLPPSSSPARLPDLLCPLGWTEAKPPHSPSTQHPTGPVVGEALQSQPPQCLSPQAQLDLAGLAACRQMRIRDRPEGIRLPDPRPAHPGSQSRACMPAQYNGPQPSGAATLASPSPG